VCDSGPLVTKYENITSSLKPEVRNVSQRRHRRTEPRPQATCTKNWWRSAVWFSSYARRQTDRRTHKLTYSSQYFATLPERS